MKQTFQCILALHPENLGNRENPAPIYTMKQTFPGILALHPENRETR